MLVVTTGGGFEMDEIGELLLGSFSDLETPLPPNPEGVARLEAAVEAVVLPPETTAVAPLPEVAREISGKTYVFEPNPAQLNSVAFEFDGSSEATVLLLAVGRPQGSAPVGLDGVYRFFTGSDGRPEAFRGARIDAETFLLEYDGITNNDHAFLQFRFDGDRVEVNVQETAHEVGAQFVGRAQQP